MGEFDEKLASLGIEVKHHFLGGYYAKECHIPAGRVLVQHKHKFDHLSYLQSGDVVVSVDGREKELSGPYWLAIEAGKNHGVKSITDAVWFCVHETDCENAEEIDAELIGESTQAELANVFARLAQ